MTIVVTPAMMVAALYEGCADSAARTDLDRAWAKFRGLDLPGKFDDDELQFAFSEKACPGHVASDHNPKVCGRCGVHVDSLRPDDDGQEAMQF